MSQPNWKLIANLGDSSPIDHGGYFVYEDTTGVYAPEAELLLSPDDYDSPQRWQVYRFSLDRCTFADGVLSDNEYHPESEAWFASPEARRAERPQDTTYLSNVAEFTGQNVAEMIADLCSDDATRRAHAYQAIGDYHGFENLDEYPITFTDRAEVEARYRDHASV